MDCIRMIGLGQGELEVRAAEDVPPAIYPVWPGCQQLTRAARGQLVSFVAGDQRLAAE